MSKFDYVREILQSRKDDNEIKLKELNDGIFDNRSRKGELQSRKMKLMMEFSKLEDEIMLSDSEMVINLINKEIESKKVEIKNTSKLISVLDKLCDEYMFEVYSATEENQEIDIALEKLESDEDTKNKKEPSTEFGDSRTLYTIHKAAH